MDVPRLVETAEICFAFWWFFGGACSFKVVMGNNWTIKTLSMQGF